MASPHDRPARGRRSLLFWLRPLVAIALLVLVGSTLPWTDRLEWKPDGGPAFSLPGKLRGDWKADAVVFLPGEEAPPVAAWPEPLRELAGPDGSVRARRGALDGGTLDWKPGMPRAFREMEPVGLVAAMALFVGALLFGITRWWRLLSVAGCRTRWIDSLRLTYLGLFFNIVVPGLTGGDVVKAVLATRENPGKRAEALVSVAVDRVIGLVVLTLLAATVILASGDTFEEIRWPVLGLLGAIVAGGLAYFNRAVRRVLRFDALLAKLPLGGKLKLIDDAVLLYRDRPAEWAWAVLLSLGNHLFNIGGIVALGRAFGVPWSEVGFWDYMALVPVAHIVSSVPVAPGGWGVGELAFKHLFLMIGASATLGVAVSVTFRLCQMALGLLGGAFLLVPGQRVDLEEIEEEARAAEGGADPAPGIGVVRDPG